MGLAAVPDPDHLPDQAPAGHGAPLAGVAREDTVVAEDEIDLDSSFIMLPQAIPQTAPAPTPGGTQPDTTPTPDPTPSGTPSTPTLGPQPGGTPALQTQVELTFTANRNQLFQVYPALANLADLAGKVTVTVKAEKADGLDKAKLQNGVLEPLEEAIEGLGVYDWLIFTSPNGVTAFFDYFFKKFKDIRALGMVRIAAVGPATSVPGPSGAGAAPAAAASTPTVSTTPTPSTPGPGAAP